MTDEIEKKVDESWKEQIWRERERAAQKPERARPAQTGATPPQGTAGAPPPGGAVRPSAERTAAPEPPTPADERAEPQPAEEEAAEGQVFESFLQSLAMQASMFLGAMPDPRTGLVSEDLGQARYLIDVLGMLERKTRGNLSGREDQLLRMLLQDLRMAYVARAQGAAGGPGPADGPPGTDAPPF